ncbi:hypothetical protein GQ44DRAFT_354574 [Phaeosphaeriaceae sp. PMI808]|nr:hypothetical protein GQ44DRAFT_354574 [Phaeosphaeriaceae sp. PMI808]
MLPAPIERLPIEILQPIFFESGYNVALLTASDRISAKLSSDYVYRLTCDHHLTGFSDNRAGQIEAQTRIFASKWMTWPVFKLWVKRAFEPYGCLCGQRPDKGCFDAQWPPNFEEATKMVFSRSHLPQLAFIKARIPKKLLSGPWCESKTQFLRFILWTTSMTVDWKDPDALAAAKLGRMQAIREGNLEAVELFNHNRRLGKIATIQMINIAVIEAGCNRSIVYDLIFTASMWGIGIDWTCPELETWCQDRIRKGDPKGQWLRIKLEELRAPSRPGKIYQGPDIGYKRLPGGEVTRESGDYHDVFDDQLVVHQHKWHTVSRIVYFFRELIYLLRRCFMRSFPAGAPQNTPQIT